MLPLILLLTAVSPTAASLTAGSLTAVSSTADTTSYWQQQVAYAISASLDEPSGTLTGHERIVYVNRSPETLRDFYVHQYLNAFRPGSRWSAADSAEGRDRFQHLKDPDYAFERITAATLQGASLAPDYPLAPDSTVAHWTLPRPLAPGDSMVVEIDWRARPSTLPRRQGREGRRFDFAQWYPKVVVYDRHGWEAHPVYPAGEFYGEFATYDVALDLAADQVIGATGVPAEGDPGWEHAKADPSLRIDYQRDWYARPPDRPTTASPTARCGAVGAGRKCVRFQAENVHHFAFSLNPQYVYEEGRYGDVVVRVLYQPQDRATWGNGIAVGRTVTALAWLDSLYGPFAWPQMTNVHRIEGGGTEFPMMVMNGGPSLGLILHEVGHNYTMGVLANNEWREGFLDEGFTSFQTGWYFETHGGRPAYDGLEPFILDMDLDRWSEPVSMVSERYRDFSTYNTMIYSKAQLFYEELRYVVGDDAMRAILRTYYARWKLKHVDERAFRDVCEEISGQDLGWLFGQWLHGTPLIDYRLKKVERRRLADGTWHTAVTIERRGDGWMPVEIADHDRIYARATGQPEVERVEFTTPAKPGRLMLDPRLRSHDWNMLNNYEKGRGREQHRLDNPTRDVVRRDKLVTAWLPLPWSNDAGGFTLGVRARSNYLGRFERNLYIGSVGLGSDATHRDGFYARIENPVRRPEPRTTSSAAAWSVEGRAGAALHVDRELRRRLVDAADPHAGFDAIWMATTDLSYLDRRLWADGGTVEAGPWVSTRLPHGRATIAARFDVRGGLAYWNPGFGIVAANRYDVEGFLRLSGEASVRAPFWLGSTLGARVFAGGIVQQAAPLPQRRFPVGGADPYQTFTNPLLRSTGALLVRPDFHYQAPGGANLRGFSNVAAGRWALALNVEGTKSLLRRRSGLVRSVAVEGFADAGVVDTMAIPSATAGKRYTTLYDGGVGLVTRHQLGDRAWTMRFELPLVVNRWDFAADQRPGKGRLALRWQVSLEPSF
jgi:peptidase M1-like protein